LKRFNADAVLEALSQGAATMFFGVPTMFVRILDAARPGRPLSGIRLMVSGSSSLSPDRKSTRLNSSHGSISYAVFCLKKNTVEAVPPHLNFAPLENAVDALNRSAAEYRKAVEQVNAKGGARAALFGEGNKLMIASDRI